MARLVLGPLTEDVRGTIGGVTFSRLRRQPYAKEYRAPRYQRTATQAERRVLFVNGVHSWPYIRQAGVAGESWGVVGAEEGRSGRDVWMQEWLTEPGTSYGDGGFVPFRRRQGTGLSFQEIGAVETGNQVDFTQRSTGWQSPGGITNSFTLFGMIVVDRVRLGNDLVDVWLYHDQTFDSALNEITVTVNRQPGQALVYWAGIYTLSSPGFGKAWMLGHKLVVPAASEGAVPE